MKQIADYTIRGKLTLIVMLTTGVALLLAVLAMGGFDLLNFRNRCAKMGGRGGHHRQQQHGGGAHLQ